MFDFGNANDAQKLAISSSNGAVLITAGPGTGTGSGRARAAARCRAGAGPRQPSSSRPGEPTERGQDRPHTEHTQPPALGTQTCQVPAATRTRGSLGLGGTATLVSCSCGNSLRTAEVTRKVALALTTKCFTKIWTDIIF